MADVRITVEELIPTGLEPTYNGSLSTENTYLIHNGGNVFVHFKKSGAVACVVTIQTPKTVGGLDVAEQTVTVPALTGDRMIGPFSPALYNDSVQDIRITLSNIAGLVIGAVKI